MGVLDVRSISLIKAINNQDPSPEREGGRDCASQV
jgi:hypothetical protein